MGFLTRGTVSKMVFLCHMNSDFTYQKEVKQEETRSFSLFRYFSLRGGNCYLGFSSPFFTILRQSSVEWIDLKMCLCFINIELYLWPLRTDSRFSVRLLAVFVYVYARSCVYVLIYYLSVVQWHRADRSNFVLY